MNLLLGLLMFAQEETGQSVDTLTTTYSDKWEGAAGVEQSGAFIQMMASNDLIFVVLAVSLIIWLVLLFFLIRLDRKIGTLEKNLNDNYEESEI